MTITINGIAVEVPPWPSAEVAAVRELVSLLRGPHFLTAIAAELGTSRAAVRGDRAPRAGTQLCGEAPRNYRERASGVAAAPPPRARQSPVTLFRTTCHPRMEWLGGGAQRCPNDSAL